MDYKELVESLKSMLPPKVLYGDLIGAEGVYAHSGPLVYEDPEPYFIEQAANAITDLLARAEAAEADNERLREAMKPNCILCDSMHESGNCTEVGGFCTAVPAAHCPMIPRLRDRAEAAEAKATAVMMVNKSLSETLKNAEARTEKAENIASDLLDDFTDFVTGGVPNASPYCANQRPECVDVRGWCKGDSKVCKGFLPRAAIEKEE